jgi:acyl carrier protein
VPAERSFPVKNNPTKRKIVAHISRVTGQKRIDLDRTFKDYAIDSITTLELLMDLEREFNITIPDEKIEQLATPRALIDLVETLQTLHVS